MLVYVVDKNGNRLMPTRRLGKVRRWLKQGQIVLKEHIVKAHGIRLLLETK